MRKKTSIQTLTIVLIALTILGLSSCSKDDDLGNLDETIMVRHEGADMPAYIYGNGSEKVFLLTLHGGPGGAGLNFRGTAFDRIEDEYAVVYFDQRGSGMAQGSYSEEDVNIDVMAEDVLALVKALRLKYGEDVRFFLLGYSWGSTLGIATLLKDQQAFLGWIQVDGPHSPRDMYVAYQNNFERVAAEQIQLENSIPFWESVNDLLEEIDPVFSRDDQTRLNSRAFQAEERLASDQVINSRGGGSNDVLFKYNLFTFFWNIQQVQSLLDSEIQGILSYTDRLHEITIPTLILWGKHDMVVPVSVAQEAFEHIGSSAKELVLFERSGHAPMATESVPFAEEVIGFMDRNK